MAASGTVPAPTSKVLSAANSAIRLGASGIVMVISNTVMPASRSQAMTLRAASVDFVRTTGTTRALRSRMISPAASFVIAMFGSHARAHA